jgi:hypothetical protein
VLKQYQTWLFTRLVGRKGARRTGLDQPLVVVLMMVARTATPASRQAWSV